MLIYTENGYRGFMTITSPRTTTLAAERHDRAVIQAYAGWARNHNEMVNSPNRRTPMVTSALTHYIKD